MKQKQIQIQNCMRVYLACKKVGFLHDQAYAVQKVVDFLRTDDSHHASYVGNCGGICSKLLCHPARVSRDAAVSPLT